MEVMAVPVVFRVVAVLQVYPFCFKLRYLFTSKKKKKNHEKGRKKST